MSLKHYFLLSIVFLVFCNMNSQVSNREYIKKWRSPDGRNINYFYTSDNTNPDEIPNLKTVGSPYINQEFQPSYIFTIEGKVFGDLVMRYNAYYDVMEFKEFITDDDSLISYIEITPELIFKIGEQVYDFVPYSGNVEKGTYFEVLYRGLTVDLYKKTNKIFTEARIARTSYEINFPRRYQDDLTYFFVSPDGKMSELKGSQNKILNSINFKKTELQNYIQQHKLNLNEELDLIKLITYLDSIL